MMPFPWEAQAGLRPWEVASPVLYPRIVAITRPFEATAGSGAGVQPYAAVLEANETAIASGLPASIQLTRQNRLPQGKTPSDAPNRDVWDVFIPGASAAVGLATERDIVTDDLGKRYVVIAAYWDALGYRLSAELLEA